MNYIPDSISLQIRIIRPDSDGLFQFQKLNKKFGGLLLKTQLRRPESSVKKPYRNFGNRKSHLIRSPNHLEEHEIIFALQEKFFPGIPLYAPAIDRKIMDWYSGKHPQENISDFTD